jgi:hypothetical protein
LAEPNCTTYRRGNEETEPTSGGWMGQHQVELLEPASRALGTGEAGHLVQVQECLTREVVGLNEYGKGVSGSKEKSEIDEPLSSRGP